MTTKQVLDRIETILRLAGKSAQPGRVLAVMLERGTYVPGAAEINLAALWVAVMIVEQADRDRWASERAG